MLNNISFKSTPGIIGFNNINTPDNKRTRKVMSSTKTARVTKDHDGAIKTLNQAFRTGILDKRNPPVLLHFDTHSDIRFDPGQTLDIGNWINKAVANGMVNEVYWVLPDWTKEGKNYKVFWKNNDEYAQDILLDSPSDKKLYTSLSDGHASVRRPENPDQYRAVVVHKVTVNDLPELTDGSNTVLDICGDYFVN